MMILRNFHFLLFIFFITACKESVTVNAFLFSKALKFQCELLDWSVLWFIQLFVSWKPMQFLSLKNIEDLYSENFKL